MVRNGHFSRKRACKPFWPGDLPQVVLCIKLWSVRGGGTARGSKFTILASVWASNSRLQRHLNGSKKARNVNPRVQKSMKTSPNVFYMESMHIRDVANKWLECWKSCAITHRNGRFPRKCTCKPFWPWEIPLVLLCVKLWSIRGGGIVRVSEFIIVASVWASNSRWQRHLHGPKKAQNVNPMVKKSMKTSPNVFYKDSVHIRDVAKKLTQVLKIVCYNPRKWHETDVFRINAPANPSGPETYPWCCYALNNGRYMEEGPSECRNSSLCLPFGQVILCCKGI
jgi:hypothetical protein